MYGYLFFNEIYTHLSKWRPPLGELYKTNYDGVVFSELSEVGIGVVVWDAKGEVIVAFVEKFTYPRSVEMLKALAGRRAVNLLLNWGSLCLNLRGIRRWCAGCCGQRIRATRLLARLSKTLCLLWVRLEPFLSLILGGRVIV